MNLKETVALGSVLLPRPERGVLRVTGPDARAWLNGVTTLDADTLQPGRGTYGLALSKQGKILSDLSVVLHAGEFFISVAPGTARALFEHLDRMLVMEDAELEDVSEVWAPLEFHGASAAEAARGLAHSVAFSPDAPPSDSLPWGALDWTGLGGALVFVRRASLQTRIEALGAHPSGALQVLSAEEWTRLRLSRAWPEFGRDYDSTHNPHEAALDRRAVSWSKGCYLGQEVVCMQDMRGKVRRRITPVSLASTELGSVVSGASVVTAAQEIAGEVTSVALSLEGTELTALARLKTAFATPGTELAVGGVAATVAAPPGAP
jgi:folate-binding protein YgfZ